MKSCLWNHKHAYGHMHALAVAAAVTFLITIVVMITVITIIMMLNIAMIFHAQSHSLIFNMISWRALFYHLQQSIMIMISVQGSSRSSHSATGMTVQFCKRSKCRIGRLRIMFSTSKSALRSMEWSVEWCDPSEMWPSCSRFFTLFSIDKKSILHYFFGKMEERVWTRNPVQVES